MRPKSPHVVITFRTTTGAMAMEQLCHARSIPGRLIPVPRAITAGCGLCWAAPPDCRTTIEELVMAEHLDVDGLYDVLL